MDRREVIRGAAAVIAAAALPVAAVVPPQSAYDWLLEVELVAGSLAGMQGPAELVGAFEWLIQVEEDAARRFAEE